METDRSSLQQWLEHFLVATVHSLLKSSAPSSWKAELGSSTHRSASPHTRWGAPSTVTAPCGWCLDPRQCAGNCLLMCSVQVPQKLLAKRAATFQKNHMASARGRPSMQYGRSRIQKRNAVVRSLTRSPTKALAVLVAVVPSHLMMTENVDLETLDPLRR